MSEMIQVPDGWEVKPLKEFMQFIKDGTHGTHEDVDIGIPLLSAKDIDNGKIDLNSEPRLISQDDYNKIHKSYQIKKNDILLTIVGTIGRVAIVDIDDIFTLQRSVAILRTNETLAPKLGYHILSSNEFLQKLLLMTNASAQGGIYLGSLGTLELKIPKEKKEQEKIAKILSTLDKSIEATNRLIEKEKNIKKALMQELLTNGIDKDGHIRSPQTHTYKESELGLIPEEWEVDKLNEVTKLMTDFVANGSFESLADNVTVFETPDFAYYVRLVDIRKGLGHEKQTYVDELSFNFLKKSSLIGREILIANIGANVGETFLMPILNKPATIAPNMIVVKVNNKIIPEFLFYFLTFYKGISELQNVTEGSGQPKINKTKLKTINVLIPSIKEQEKIINILTIQDKKIETEETNLAKLKELKKGLMNDLLSGKVRVKV